MQLVLLQRKSLTAFLMFLFSCQMDMILTGKLGLLIVSLLKEMCPLCRQSVTLQGLVCLYNY